MKLKAACLILALCLASFSAGPLPVAGAREGHQDHQGHDHGAMATRESMDMEPADLAAQVRVEERLGDFIDFSARFLDQAGRPVDLKTIIDRPVVLLPVYFVCPSVCNLLQANLADAMNRIKEVPGKDFAVIILSFSDDEDPSHARAAKDNYAGMVKRETVPERWYYLTGDRENILKLTRSMGYYFIKTKPDFYIHPNALAILARDGKIIRYLYGPRFLPFDISMGLTEAGQGEPGLSIKRGVMSFCFDYDPENKTYVFKMFRITGTVILILVAGFLLFLIIPGRAGKKRGRQHR